nr:hypothetical protein [Tanacetum cinerariifolium]
AVELARTLAGGDDLRHCSKWWWAVVVLCLGRTVGRARGGGQRTANLSVRVDFGDELLCLPRSKELMELD